MRIRILLALIVLAAIAGLWWIGRDDSLQERSREFVEAPEPPVEERVADEPDPVEAGAESEWAPIETKGLPPDPVELGSCDLLLRVVDVETGEPVRTQVILWRLDAPANEHWTQGDQVQRHQLAAHGVTRFEDLPEGSYRAVCMRRRLAGDDSRVLHVQGELTEATIAIHMPRKYRAYLKVFDPEGNLVTKGTLERRGESRVSVKQAPAWCRPRRLIDPGDGFYSHIGAGGGTAASGRNSWEATATEKGFLLGELEENPYAWKLTYRFGFKRPGSSSIVARIEGDFEAGATWIGLTVPDEPIRERILLPDGKRADKNGAYLAIWTDAIRDDGSPAFPRLQRLSVRVVGMLRGFRDVSFEVLPGEMPPVRLFEPKPPAARQG